MTAEFIKDLNIDDYHKKTDFLSKSMLSKFADCPARYKHFYIDGNEQRKTKSLRLGNAVHVLSLEPDTWEKNYHVMPTSYFNDKGEEKEWRNDFRMQVVKDQYESAGYEIEKEDGKKAEPKETPRSKIILTQSEYNTVETMAEALTRDTYAISLLKADGYVESSIFWEDEESYIDDTGEEKTVRVKKKCRPDLKRNDGLLVDLKIARSVKPEIFFADAHNYHYDLSVAMSFEGYERLHEKEPDNYVFIAVEQDAPNLISCFDSLQPIEELGGISYLDYSRIHYRSMIEKFSRCMAENKWPSYQNKITGMKIPAWAVKQFLEKGI